MSRWRGSQRLTRRLVVSTVPFCQGGEGSQNYVCVPISACRCGQETNAVPRSKVMERRAGWGMSRIAAITGFVYLPGFFSRTVNRLTGSTNEVTLFWPSSCLKRIRSPFAMAEPAPLGDSVGAQQDADVTVKIRGWNLGGRRLRARLGRRAVRRLGKYHHRSQHLPSLE